MCFAPELVRPGQQLEVAWQCVQGVRTARNIDYQRVVKQQRGAASTCQEK